MLGGASGAKFVVNFSIEGSGESDLKRISGLFKGIQQQAGSSNGKGVAAGLGDASGHAEALHGSLGKAKGHMEGFGATAMVGMEAMEKIGEAGVALVEAGAGILEMWGKAFEVLIHKGQEFESLILRIQGSGKTRGEAIHMMDQALEITKMLPLTEMDAARIAQTFSTIHIDATKRLGESYEELNKKGKTMKGLDEIIGVEKMKKEGPKAVTVVADMLAAMGHLGTGYQTQAIHEMMVTLETGKIMSKLTFAGLGGDLEKFRHKLAAARDPAARLIAMQEILSKRGALGLSQAAMTTWGGVMSNFKGIIDQFAYQILQPGKAGGLLSQLTKGMSDLYDTIKEFFDETNPKGQEFLHTLRATFSMVGGWMMRVVKEFGVVLKQVMSFFGQHPMIARFAAGLSVLAGVALIAGGAFITLSALLGGVAIALAALPEILLAPLALLGLFPPLLAAMTVGVAVVSAAWVAWDKDLGGIKTTILDVKLVIEGVMEAFEDWHGGMASISEETAAKLERRGLMGVFLKLINFARQAQMFWEGMTDGFGRRWDGILPKFSRAWDTLGTALGRIMDAVKSILGAFGLMVSTGNKAVNDAASSGERWGDRLADVAEVIATVVEVGTDAFLKFIGYVPDMIVSFSNMYMTVLYLKAAFKEVWAVASLAFDVVKLGISNVMSTLAPLVDLVWGAVKALTALQHLDFSGAYEAAATGIKNANTSSKYWSEARANAANAIPEDIASVAAAEKEKGEAYGKGMDFRNNALAAYAKISKGGSLAPTPPALFGPPAPPEMWDAREKADREARLNAAAVPNRGHQAMTQVIELKVDREVLARVVNKANEDNHKQAGGHTAPP